MSLTKDRKGPMEIVFVVLAVLYLLFFAGELDLSAAEPLTWERVAIPAAFAALIPGFLPLWKRMLRSSRFPGADRFRKNGTNLLLILSAGLAARIIWWLAMSPRIISDYQFYTSLAKEYAESGALKRDVYLLTVAPNVPLFAAVLGRVMRVFGTEAVTAQIFCLALHLCSLGLLYLAGRELTTARRAFYAAFLFALLPENVFYSNLPGSESAAMCTLLAGLLLILKARKKEPVPGSLLCFSGGLALAFSGCIRPNAWAAVPGVLLLLARKSPERAFLRRTLPLLLSFLLAAAGVLAWHQAFQHRIFRGETPSGGIGWSLYEGLDLESGGKWTEEKSERCITVINTYPPEETDAVFLREALERFHSYTFFEKIRLFLRKGGSLWYESRYSLISAEDSPAFRRLHDAALLAWYACIAVLTACLFFRFRHRAGPSGRDGGLLCLPVILLTTAWHEAGTSIGRYHYMLIPFVLLLTALLLPGNDESGIPGKGVKP